MTTPEITFEDPRRQPQEDSAFEAMLERDRLRRDGGARALPAPMSDDAAFEAMLQRDRGRRKTQDQAMLRAMHMATKVSPEFAGDVERLSLDLGAPEAFVAADIERARGLWQQRQLNALRMSGGSPITIRRMLDPEFARVAVDDSENLSFTENLFRQWDAARLEERQALLWEKVRSGQADDRDHAEINDIGRKLDELPANSDIGGFFESVAYSATRIVGGMVGSLGEALGTGTAMAGTAVVAGQLGPQAALPEEIVSVPAMFSAGFFGQLVGSSGRREGGAAYGQMIRMGISHDIASRYSLGIGTVSGILEGVSAGILSKPFRNEAKRILTQRAAQQLLTRPTRTAAARDFAVQYAKGIGAEVATELAQEVANVVGEELAIMEQQGVDPSTLDIEGRAPLFDRMVEVASEVSRGMLLLGLPGPALSTASNLSRARKASADQAWFETLSETASESKVRTRSPNQFRRFLEQTAEGSGAENVYIDRDMFEKAMRTAGLSEQQLLQISPRAHQAFVDSRDTGTLEIPTAEYVASLGEFGTSLIPDLRLTPDGFSGKEALQVQEQAEADFERVEVTMTEEGQINDAVKAELDTLELEITTQLQKAGQRPEVATAAARYYRHFVLRMATDQGVMPAEWQRTSGLAFAPRSDLAGLEDAAALDQGSDAFRQWFGESKVVDEAGEPITVFHGTRTDFDEFDSSQAGGTDSGWLGRGFYFTTNRQTAAHYAGRSRDFDPDLVETEGAWQRTVGDARIGEFFIALQNPLTLRPEGVDWVKGVEVRKAVGVQRDATPEQVTEALREQGYDGVILDYSGTFNTNEREVMALDPEQIKSVNNRGAFDPNSPNILEQLGDSGWLGRFLPDLNTAFLDPEANPSTVFHEMSHFFMFAMLDLVERGVATDRVGKNVDTLLQWFQIDGATPEARFEAWNAMDLKAQEKHHEAFARSFEVYLYEGQAPTAPLGRLFAKVRSWMIQVYTDVRTRINAAYRNKFGVDLPGLTPEVRQVFDSLVASEEAIATAEAVRSMIPAFQTREQFTASGHTEADWDRYQQALDDAREAAVTDLSVASLKQQQWLRNRQGTVAKEMARKRDELRKKTRKEVEEQVVAEQAYQVDAALRDAPAAGKLNQAQVEALLEGLDPQTIEDNLAKLGKGRRKGQTLLSPQGTNLEIAAGVLGYESGGEMVRALIALRPIEQEIDIRTDQRMLQEHGELVDDAQVKAAVDRALHREARARFLATELRFLEGATRPTRIILAAAKEVARRILGGQAVRDIRPDRRSQAEAREARAVQKIMTDPKGNPRDAIDAKRRQLLNNILTKQSHDARKEIAKILRSFRDLNRQDESLSRLGDLDLLQAAQWILAQYGLATEAAGRRAANYLQLVREYDPALFELLKPDMEMAANRGAAIGSWRELSLDELRAVHETVETLRFRAKRDQEVLAEGKKVAVDTARAEMLEQLGAVPDKVGGEHRALTPSEILGNEILSGKALLTRIEHYLRHKDGGKQGPFLRYIFNGVRHALDNYRRDAKEHVKRLVDDIADMRKRGLISDGTIEAGELNYTFGNGKVAGMAELLGALLHARGNESNRSKFLIAGRGAGASWADWNADGTPNYDRWERFVQRLIDSGILTKEHFDFLQRTWDSLESILPQIQEAHKEITGRYFPRVPNKPFEIRFADGRRETYRGGYVPAARDRTLLSTDRIEVKLEEMQAEFHQGLPKASDGFTKERVEQVVNRPLAMDINQIASHIDESIRYAHVQPRVADVLRLLNKPEFSAALERVDRNVIRGVMMPFLERAVRQSLYTPGKWRAQDQFWKMIRKNTGIGIMFNNVTVAVQQLTGLSNAFLYVKGRHLRSALYAHIRNGGIGDSVAERSAFMADRFDHQAFSMTQDLRESLLEATATGKISSWVSKNAYWMQAMMQNMVDAVTWEGAYQQAVTQGLDERSAVRDADSAVRLSQGSFNPEDVANYEVNTPLNRTWTQFTSYFNTVMNQVRFSDNKVRAAIIGFSVPMVMAQAIAMTLWQRWDDEDDDGHLDTMFDLFVGSQVGGVVAMVPGYGPTALGFVEYAVTGDRFAVREASSPGTSTLIRSIRGLIEAVHAGTDEDRDLTGRKTRDALMAMILFVRQAAPLAAITRPAAYLTDVLQGTTDPTGPVDAAFGFMTGRGSAASRE